jgi:hypothetical protein
MVPLTPRWRTRILPFPGKKTTRRPGQNVPGLSRGRLRLGAKPQAALGKDANPQKGNRRAVRDHRAGSSYFRQ